MDVQRILDFKPVQRNLNERRERMYPSRRSLAKELHSVDDSRAVDTIDRYLGNFEGTTGTGNLFQALEGREPHRTYLLMYFGALDFKTTSPIVPLRAVVKRYFPDFDWDLESEVQ